MQSEVKKPKENPLLSILLNVILPSAILNKGKDFLGLDTIPTVAIALAIPLGYGLYEFIRLKKVDFISVLGFINVLLTGGMTILAAKELMPVTIEWYAWKEMGVPLLIGLAVLFSLKGRNPIVQKMLLNDEVMDVDKIHSALEVNHNESDFKNLMKNSTMMLSVSFFISAALNYILAKIILTEAPGSDAFNAQLGEMGIYSYPVILLPSLLVMGFVLWYLFRGIHDLTGLKFQEILKNKEE